MVKGTVSGGTDLKGCLMLIRRRAEPLALAAKLKVLQLVGFAIYSFQNPNHRHETGAGQNQQRGLHYPLDAPSSHGEPC